MSIDRERRRTAVGTRVLNTPISEETYRLLKRASKASRKAMGVILDELLPSCLAPAMKADATISAPEKS